MRIISFFKKPLPESIVTGLAGTAQIQYWDDLTDEERSDLTDIEILITNPPVRMDAKLLTNFPNLKMIASLGVGFDKFDLEEMKRRGIVLTNAPSQTLPGLF